MRHIRILISLSIVMFINESAGAQGNDKRFDQWDQNRDGKLSETEFPKVARSFFEKMDGNGDETVSREELATFMKNRRGNSPDRRQQQNARSQQTPAPTHADVAYGKHAKQAFDLWLAKSSDGKPTPLVIYIHGGGFRSGDKRGGRLPVRDYLEKGISFVSMNYRLSDVGPYPIMMHDSARGLQYIRSRASEWNLDPQKVACYGGSAGAGISLWLGFHDDLAQPDSEDPIARESTRITAAATQGGQSTYDMRTFRKWFGVPDLVPHPALNTFYAVEKEEDWESDRVIKLMTDASPITHLSKDDIPVFMTYNRGDVAIDLESDAGVWVHHVRLGLKLKEAMSAIGLECHVSSPEHQTKEFENLHAFLQAKLLKKTENADSQP